MSKPKPAFTMTQKEWAVAYGPTGDRTMCETHDVPGACTMDCLYLQQDLDNSGYAGESMVYSDYLGGTSSIDVSGCHGAKPMPTEAYRLDAARGRVFVVKVHPEDCQCGEAECTAYEDDPPGGVCTNGPGCTAVSHYLSCHETEDDGAPCCMDPDCGGNPCTFPGYADNH